MDYPIFPFFHIGLALFLRQKIFTRTGILIAAGKGMALGAARYLGAVDSKTKC